MHGFTIGVADIIASKETVDGVAANIAKYKKEVKAVTKKAL